MEALHVYLPTDRRYALLRGVDLPNRTTGAALFADISGFTTLTEALVRALGPQRGVEELAGQLNVIYDALIAEIDRYGGSVISFSGDAITCWFDDKAHTESEQESHDARSNGVARAVACAFAMQQTMQQFANVTIPNVGSVVIAIKVAVTSGPVRRFTVGDPTIQTIDVLAGEILYRLATAEHLAAKGEVVIDEPAHTALREQTSVLEWRTDGVSGQRFAVINGLTAPVAPMPWHLIEPAVLDTALLRRWLLPPVFERLESGHGEFLTELRPAVALFLRFSGIDYDTDQDAQHKLHTFIQWVQRILARYDAFLIQLTIGDKGSYLYTASGAPVAHEDDVMRALAAALELREPHFDYISGVQIGISLGRMRTGAYGGVTRRTYSVLGDEVNMAARLMQNAPLGQVLVSQDVQRIVADAFVWQPFGPLQVKGKSQSITPFLLLHTQDQRVIRLHEPKYARPMVGRQAELALIERKLDQSLRGHGQIIGITGEAGMGKSRLMAEVIRMAHGFGVASFGGECQSYGTNTSYLVWRNIWHAFFSLDLAQPLEQQVQVLERSLAQIDPTLLPRLPLLGTLLNLDIPDNDLTVTFDAKLRKASLEAILVDCLRARARKEPLLLVLEECHWIDPLSHDLLDVIGRAVADVPVLIALAYRPPQLQRLAALNVTELVHFSEVVLTTLPYEEIEQLVGDKLKQLYGEQVNFSPELVAQMAERTQGNPFYIEELLNYLHDRGVDPEQPGAIQQTDLPSSLHSLILSRIDRLTEDQRTLLKVASVIGRLFPAAMVWGISPFFGTQERLRHELETLTALDLTEEDRPEPELTYLFKHIVTQEVAYESLPFATRAVLHEQIGQYFEGTYPNALDRYIDLLAYHYDHSQNKDRRRTYLLKAGDIARATYANTAAIDYYQRVLPLLSDDERSAVLLNLGQVLEVVGRWGDAQARYNETLELANERGDNRTQAHSQARIGELLRKQGQYTEALPWLEQARVGFEALSDRDGQAQVLHFLGSLAMHQGNYEQARNYYEASLDIRHEQQDLQTTASLVSNLSIVAYHQGDLDSSWSLCREGLALRREQGNKLWIANSLGNLGMLALETGQYDEARSYMEEALALEREVGDRSAIAISLNNLGSVAREQGDYLRAYNLYRESLVIARDLGDSWSLCYLLEDIGCLAALQGRARDALQLSGAAAILREHINAPLSPPEQTSLQRKLEPARATLGPTADSVWSEGRSLGVDAALALALTS